jgi:guanyl-specific ribonuclease Sa
MSPQPGAPIPSPSQWLVRLLVTLFVVGAIVVVRGRLVPQGQAPPRASVPPQSSAAAPAVSTTSLPAEAEQGDKAKTAELPDGVQATLDRIARGESYPHRDDGTVFGNREGLLPAQPAGYYREFVHPTPGVRGPGARRLVVGRAGEVYYTRDHYRSFTRLDIAFHVPQ